VFRTPVLIDYSLLWRGVRGQRKDAFKVKACSDVRIIAAATERVTSVDAYELIIGGWGNKKSGIKTQTESQEVAIQAETPDILSCTQSRWFWLSWDMHVLRFGQGRYAGVNELLKFALPYIPDSLGFTGTSDAEWEFVNHRGTQLKSKESFIALPFRL
jgi:hypothetical protein